MDSMEIEDQQVMDQDDGEVVEDSEFPHFPPVSALDAQVSDLH